MENFNPLPSISPTPIKLDSLARELQCYPNADFKNELINSFTFGFKIGYSGPEFSYKAYNLKSAETYPHIIAGNTLSELKEKRVAGPFVLQHCEVAFPSLFGARSHFCFDQCFRPFFSHFATIKFL